MSGFNGPCYLALCVTLVLLTATICVEADVGEMPVVVSIPDTSTLDAAVQIPVRIGNTTGLGITGVGFAIAFDSHRVTVSGIETGVGMAASGWLVASNVVGGSGESDTLKVAMATAQDALNGSGDLVYLDLIVDLAPLDVTVLHLAQIVLNEGFPPADTQDGTLRGAVSVSLPDTLGLPADTVRVPIRIGDVTGLDILAAEIETTYDSRVVRAVGVETAGCMTETWLVGSSLKAGVGYIDTFRVGISTAQHPLSGSGDLIILKLATQNIKHPSTTDLQLTRVLLNEGLPAASPQNGALKLAAHARISNTGAFYTEAKVPIRIDDVVGWGIIAAEFHVAYDRRKIGFLGVETANSLAGAGWLAQANVVTGAGGIDTLKVAMSTGQDTLNGSGNLVYLKLKTAGGLPPDSIGLFLTKAIFNDGLPGAILQDGWLRFNGVASLPDTTANYADTMCVPVRVGDVTGLGILAAEVSVAYDRAVVEALGVETVGSMADGWFVDTVVKVGSSGVDTLRMLLSTATDTLSGAGDLAYLNLATTNARRSASTSLAITRLVFNEQGTPARLRNGSVKLLGSTGFVESSRVVQAREGRSGRDTVRVSVVDADLNVRSASVDTALVVVLNARSGETEALRAVEINSDAGIFLARLPAVSGVSVSSDGVMALAGKDVLIVTYTDSLNASGNTVPASDTTCAVDLFGDVTGNGSIAAFDVSSILQFSVGLAAASAYDSLVADVDGDRGLLAFDASLVMQHVVHLIDRFPIQSLVFDDLSKRNHPFLKPAMGELNVELGHPQVETGGDYLIPVMVDKREGIVSGMLELGAATHMRIKEIMAAAGYAHYFFAHRTEPGHAWIAFAGSGSRVKGPGEIMRVRLGGEAIGDIWIRAVRINGQTQQVSASRRVQAPRDGPLNYALYPNAPNPFNPETTFQYNLPERSEVRLIVHNLLGQQMRVLVAERQEAGRYRVVWDGKDSDGRDLGSGIYLIHLEAGEFVRTQKTLLLR